MIQAHSQPPGFPSLPAGFARLDLDRVPDNPLGLLQDWISSAQKFGVADPMSVSLASANPEGVSSSRTVLLLEVSAEALLFATNFASRKGVELLATSNAAVSVYWRETAQSVNVSGDILVADDRENDARFAAEPRTVQASRAVSVQGVPLLDEAAQLAAFRGLVASSNHIPRPEQWRWFRLIPRTVTFWEGHADALNRRVHYARDPGVDWAHWQIQA
jgi:pyridoxine/pyridoxamine 5'-phosphate oxidase